MRQNLWLSNRLLVSPDVDVRPLRHPRPPVGLRVTVDHRDNVVGEDHEELLGHVVEAERVLERQVKPREKKSPT